MNLSDLKDLYRHMEWADAEVWRAVLTSEPARNDDILRKTFYHLHLVQQAWLGAWRGKPGTPSFPTFHDERSLMSWGQTYYQEIFSHLDNLTDEKISGLMQLPWADIVEQELGRPPEKITIAETMLQIPMHSQYHRGQINGRLRTVGGEPAKVDHIVWVWLGRPQAEWESD
jgi:uncharacterized damage-inducible protein DinB